MRAGFIFVFRVCAGVCVYLRVSSGRHMDLFFIILGYAWDYMPFASECLDGSRLSLTHVKLDLQNACFKESLA